MNFLLRICMFGGLAWASSEALVWVLAPPCSKAEGVRGTYVEARSASVFAGACHVNGEAASQGRHALLAWRVEEGQWRGTDLSGVEVAAVVGAEGNLARDGARRSRIWIDAADAGQRAATRTWLEERHGATLGEIVSVVEGTLDFELEGDDFQVVVPDQLTLRGRLDADRSCCSMPEQVWYEPLTQVDDALVGFSLECSFAGAGADVPWSYPGQNNAFVARFEDAPAPAAARALLPCCELP